MHNKFSRTTNSPLHVSKLLTLYSWALLETFTPCTTLVLQHPLKDHSRTFKASSSCVFFAIAENLVCKLWCSVMLRCSQVCWNALNRAINSKIHFLSFHCGYRDPRSSVCRSSLRMKRTGVQGSMKVPLWWYLCVLPDPSVPRACREQPRAGLRKIQHGAVGNEGLGSLGKMWEQSAVLGDVWLLSHDRQGNCEHNIFEGWNLAASFPIMNQLSIPKWVVAQVQGVFWVVKSQSCVGKEESFVLISLNFLLIPDFKALTKPPLAISCCYKVKMRSCLDFVSCCP